MKRNCKKKLIENKVHFENRNIMIMRTVQVENRAKDDFEIIT